ncbi:flagellin FliC, partial [Kosakonia cowanii]|nr:flagellin FliC [Kosakonia cowanii]
NQTATAKSYNFQVGAKDGETISISMNGAAGWNLASAKTNGTTTNPTANGTYANTVAANTLATVAGDKRKVNAIGFDVISGKVSGATAGSGSPLKDIDAAIKAVDTQRSSLGASQ